MLDAGGHPEALEAALQAVYAPRDPIAEYWRGEITLRALRVLVMYMPDDNALTQAMGEGWTETQWLLHDIGDQLRDMQLTDINTNPWVNRKYTASDIRASIPTPMQRVQRAQHDTPIELGLREQVRGELMAAIT